MNLANDQLLLLALLALSLYIPISRGRPKRVCGLPIDRRIPFIPAFVYPYIALLPFFIAALYLLHSTPYATPFYTSLIIVGLLYALFAPYIGCGAARGDVSGRGLTKRLVRFVYKADGRYNNDVFPSTHVYTSTICGYFLVLAFPEYAVFSTIAAVLIAVSTVFIKQHNLMDIAGGLLWGATSIMLANTLLAGLG